jgi:hypothetical protein
VAELMRMEPAGDPGLTTPVTHKLGQSGLSQRAFATKPK